MNTFGTILRLTSWGESHGVAIGGVVDGFPSGFTIDLEALQAEVLRRAPGQHSLSTPRKEADQVQILSGLLDGRTTGAPISFLIANNNTKPKDYSQIADIFRPGHADYTYQVKYGLRDHRGGGRSSARETAVRVVAGALAKQWLANFGIEVFAYADTIGNVSVDHSQGKYPFAKMELEDYRDTILRVPKEYADQMEAEIAKARSMGDSVGGIISCVAYGIPIGLGEPIYDKLEARLSAAMMSINATRGFELGDGFDLARSVGSDSNDAMTIDSDSGLVQFCSNHAGGTLGGISMGTPLEMRVAFKPTPSIARPQNTISLSKQKVVTEVQGRHDPCVIPRAIPVVEAMCALVLMDMMLLNRTVI